MLFTTPPTPGSSLPHAVWVGHMRRCLQGLGGSVINGPSLSPVPATNTLPVTPPNTPRQHPERLRAEEAERQRLAELERQRLELLGQFLDAEKARLDAQL